MNRLSANSDYQILQVRISYIILNNLKKIGKDKNELIALKLSKKKIERLYDNDIADNKKRGLNLSDIQRIVEALDLGYDLIFIGKNSDIL